MSDFGWFSIGAVALIIIGTMYEFKLDKELAIEQAVQATEQQKQYNICLFKLMANGIDIAIIEKQNMCNKPIGLKPSTTAPVQSN